MAHIGTCIECGYCTERPDGLRECRRYPPTYHPNRDPHRSQGDGSRLQASYPIVDPWASCCGESDAHT